MLTSTDQASDAELAAIAMRASLPPTSRWPEAGWRECPSSSTLELTCGLNGTAHTGFMTGVDRSDVGLMQHFLCGRCEGEPRRTYVELGANNGVQSNTRAFEAHLPSRREP